VTIFVLAVSFAGDPAFLWNFVVVGPVFALAGAGSAAGSLALARRAQGRGLLQTTEDLTAVGYPRERRERCGERATEVAAWNLFAFLRECQWCAGSPGGRLTTRQ